MFANVYEQANKNAALAAEGAGIFIRLATEMAGAGAKAGQRAAALAAKAVPGASGTELAREGVASFFEFAGETGSAARNCGDDMAALASKAFGAMWDGFDAIVEKTPKVPAGAKDVAAASRVAAKTGVDAVTAAAKAGVEAAAVLGAAVEKAAKASVSKAK